MSITEYKFPAKPGENGFRLFPDKVEDDPNVVFHGTPYRNFDSIIAENVWLTGKSKCASYANKSAGALQYACSNRQGAQGCIFVAQFKCNEGVKGIAVEVSHTHVYIEDARPEIIGFMVVPKEYLHV